jgi:hypothetical protein
MIRKIAVSVSATAIAVAGLAAAGVGTASAAPKPIISTVTTGHVDCNIEAKATVVPALKNNWVKADHQTDTFGSPTFPVRQLNNVQYASTAPVNTSAKGKSVSCSGTISGTGVNGPGTATLTGLKITLTQHTAAVDNPPLSTGGATCANLLAGTSPGDQAATYKTVLGFKTSGAKVAETTITGQTITPAGLGFQIAGGTITGSWAGGTGSSQANVSADVINAVLAPAATGSAPTPNPTCQANLKLKAATPKKPASASLKGPKGLKKIETLPSSTFSLDKG